MSAVLSGGNSSANLEGRAGTQTITNGASSQAVVFSSTLATTAYALVCEIKNVTDATPIFLEVVETVQAATGFTAIFNAPTDTGNYVLNYIAVKSV